MVKVVEAITGLFNVGKVSDSERGYASIITDDRPYIDVTCMIGFGVMAI